MNWLFDNVLGPTMDWIESVPWLVVASLCVWLLTVFAAILSFLLGGHWPVYFVGSVATLILVRIEWLINLVSKHDAE